MPYQPVVFSTFGGLNTRDDPEEVGPQVAVDLDNVDIDQRGRLRSRMGTVAVNASVTTWYVLHYFAASDQVLAVSSGGTTAFNATTGAVVAAGGPGGWSMANFGTPTGSAVYIASGTATLAKWDGAAFSTPVYTGYTPVKPLVATWQDRLATAGADAGANPSRVYFSDPGVPTTWGVNNYVTLSPGDGEEIIALAAWRDLLFAFKQSKFFVFYGTSTDGNGNPVFNYRRVDAGVGAQPYWNATAPSPEGLYFVSSAGVYRTTGDEPARVSGALDPSFFGASPTIFAPLAASTQAVYANGRLCVPYNTTFGNANTNALLIYDTATDQWLKWSYPASGICLRTGSTYGAGVNAGNELFVAKITGGLHKFSPAATTDAGSAINWYWTSGVYDLGTQGTKFLRWTRLWGSGTPTVSVFTDHGSTDTQAGAVPLGTSPAIAEGYLSKARQGQFFQHKLSGSSPAVINRLQHDLEAVRA